jgi:hypothetical protein
MQHVSDGILDVAFYVRQLVSWSLIETVQRFFVNEFEF